MSLVRYKDPTSGSWNVLDAPINMVGKLNFVSVEVSADKKTFDLSNYITNDSVDFILFYSIGDDTNQTNSDFYKAIFIPEENSDNNAQFLGLASSTGGSGGIYKICNKAYSTSTGGGGDFTDSSSASSSFGNKTDVLTYQNRKLTTTTCFGNKAILAYVG